jgi:hypothetical protein
MTTVLISGWKVGLQKVQFTQLLQRELGYSLSGAKDVTDAVVEGEAVELQVPECGVERLLLAMTQLGADCADAVTAARWLTRSLWDSGVVSSHRW